jgi:hypothetical protein
LRYKKPDHKNAQSLVDAAEFEMKYTLTVELTEKSASTIIRNIYECFRMLGDALMLAEGAESEDHILPIKKLTELNIETKRPVYVIDNMRRLRHNINYYGYRPSLMDAEEAIAIAKSLFEPVLKEVKKRIK